MAQEPQRLFNLSPIEVKALRQIREMEALIDQKNTLLDHQRRTLLSEQEKNPLQKQIAQLTEALQGLKQDLREISEAREATKHYTTGVEELLRPSM